MHSGEKKSVKIVFKKIDFFLENFAKFLNVFASFLDVFIRFSKLWDVFGPIRIRSDLLRKLTFYHVSQKLANMPANIG